MRLTPAAEKSERIAFVKHRFLLLAVASSVLATASLHAQPSEDAENGGPNIVVTAKPEIGEYGFDAKGMDMAVQPGDDFYNYANGTWAKDTPIPADKSNYGMFTVLDDLSKSRTQGILDEAVKDPSSKIGNAYASYLDLKTVQAKGLSPIQPWLNEIEALGDKSGYPELVAKSIRNGVGGPFFAYVGQDDKDPETYIMSFYQSGLGMPDRDYYLTSSPEMVKTRTAYLQHLTNMLKLAGQKDAAARASAVMALETNIASVHWTKVRSRDADKTYNKMSVAELNAAAPGFDFDAMLKANGVNTGNVLVAQPSAFTGEAAIIAAAPLQVLKDQLLIQSLDTFAEYLPENVAKENFAFFGTALSGTPEREIRWKRAVTFVKNSLGEEVGKTYVAEYFPPKTKATADQMVKNIIAAMGRRIDNLEWMSEDRKSTRLNSSHTDISRMPSSA